MTGRHALLLLSAAAIALCALLVFRALDDTDLVDDQAPAEAAAPPAAPPMRTEPTVVPDAPAPPPSPPAESTQKASSTAKVGTGLEAANADLRHLAKLLRNSRATNEELLAAIDVVRQSYLNPPMPLGHVLQVASVEAAEPARPVVDEVTLRLLAGHERWPHDYEQEVLAWRRKAEKLFLQALKLKRIDRDQGKNLREDVNIRAVQALAATGNPLLSKGIIKTFEKTILKAKYDVSQEAYDESFDALATLGHEDTLEWLRDEFIHANRSPASHVAELKAAHRAMRRFDRDKIAGRDRYEIVREMVKTYSGVESMARQSDAEASVERFWAQVREGVIGVVQYYAHDPLDAAGEPLATMAEFQAWFRDHKDQRRPPWLVE